MPVAPRPNLLRALAAAVLLLLLGLLAGLIWWNAALSYEQRRDIGRIIAGRHQAVPEQQLAQMREQLRQRPAPTPAPPLSDQPLEQQDIAEFRRAETLRLRRLYEKVQAEQAQLEALRQELAAERAALRSGRDADAGLSAKTRKLYMNMDAGDIAADLRVLLREYNRLQAQGRTENAAQQMNRVIDVVRGLPEYLAAEVLAELGSAQYRTEIMQRLNRGTMAR